MQWSFQNYIMLKSSKKKLIAIGCSYTEHYLRSDHSPDIDHDFPRWPQHLADMLDMECINLGRSGAGNKYILSKIVDTVLTEKNIGLVVVMWSQFQRLDFEYSSTRWRHININTDQIKIDWDYKQKNFKELHNPHSATQDALRTFILAEKLLKDIPHLYIQGPSAINYYNTKTLKTIDCFEGTPYFGRPETENTFHRVNDSRAKIVDNIIRSPYLNYIENTIGNKFIGWPIMHEIGGYDVDNILDKVDPERTQLRISDEDCHPNREGHKIIAQEIYNAYEKNYI